MVTQTTKDIARLTVLMRRGDKQLKLQIEKLTADFADALQRYTDIQKVKKSFVISMTHKIMKFQEKVGFYSRDCFLGKGFYEKKTRLFSFFWHFSILKVFSFFSRIKIM